MKRCVSVSKFCIGTQSASSRRWSACHIPGVRREQSPAQVSSETVNALPLGGEVKQRLAAFIPCQLLELPVRGVYVLTSMVCASFAVQALTHLRSVFGGAGLRDVDTARQSRSLHNAQASASYSDAHASFSTEHGPSSGAQYGSSGQAAADPRGYRYGCDDHLKT